MTAEKKVQTWYVTFLRKAVPIAVSAGIIYYYFRGMEWERIIAETSRANLGLAVAAVALPQFIFWYFETLIVHKHFTWFHKPFPWREYFWVRGAIYILMFVNVALGGGGIVYYIKRKAEISWKKLGGIMLFRFGLTMWGLTPFLIVATALMHYYGVVDEGSVALYIWWGVLVFGFLWMIEGWLVWNRDRNFGLAKYLVRDRQSEFWTAFRLAGNREWWLTWAMTLPPFFLMLVGVWLLALAFGIEVPFVRFIALAPLFWLVMDLPIAFAGFGTATMSWNLFFGSYGTEADVAALTLFLPFARSATRAVIGAISLKPALNEIKVLSGDEEKGS